MFFPDHSCSPVGPERAAALFRQAALTVEMSKSRYCNRRCPYCPNAPLHRTAARETMADRLFTM